LDAFQQEQKEKIEAKRKAVLTVDGQTVKADLKGKAKSFDDFWEDADMAVIDDAYRRAARVFTPDISRTYVDYLAYKVAKPDDDAEEFLEAIAEARVTVAGLGLVTEIASYFDTEADKLAKEWLAQHGPQIKALTDDRKESYRQIVEMSTEPQDVDMVKPEAKFEPTKARDGEKETDLPVWKNHLLCDENGNYPAELNAWEAKVVETESKRKGFGFWYRNPQQPGQSSLGIAYSIGDRWEIVRPDFVFFATQDDGSVAADIVDPHGTHLADALPKLQGLAIYAETHASTYRRIESIAEGGGRLRVLDLTRPDVRAAIAATTTAAETKGLYEGLLANDYG